jgi:glucokinase
LSLILADLGGTHLRLARADNPREIQKFKISDHENPYDLIKSYAPDITGLYLAAAIHPRDGKIEDRRFGQESHWSIDLGILKSDLNLKDLRVYNDLEAAAYALSNLALSDADLFVKASQNLPHFKNPPKLLIGVGTGIGHAFLFEGTNGKHFVQRSHGGHLPPSALNDEQRNILHVLGSKKETGRELIVEDIVSGFGVERLRTFYDEKTAIRLFWEFFGLYTNLLVSVCGAYGGVYLTGGLMDDLFEKRLEDSNAFLAFFIPKMVPVVVESLSSTPVYYCKNKDMPILGLANLSNET